MNRWWPRRRTRSTTPTPPAVAFSRCPTPPPEPDEQVLDRQMAALVTYGRIVRDIHTSGEHPIDGGQVFVCGVGMTPIAVAIAAANLQDALDRRNTHPDDTTAATAVTTTRTAMAAAPGAAATTGDPAPAPSRPRPPRRAGDPD